MLALTDDARSETLAALRREPTPPDLTHPAMAVDLAACIQCTRCVRACREVQHNDVIGMAYRGHGSKVVFDVCSCHAPLLR